MGHIRNKLLSRKRSYNANINNKVVRTSKYYITKRLDTI